MSSNPLAQQQQSAIADEVTLLIKTATGWLYHSKRPSNHPDVAAVLNSHPDMAVQLKDGTIIPGKSNGASV